MQLTIVEHPLANQRAGRTRQANHLTYEGLAVPPERWSRNH